MICTAGLLYGSAVRSAQISRNCTARVCCTCAFIAERISGGDKLYFHLSFSVLHFTEEIIKALISKLVFPVGVLSRANLPKITVSNFMVCMCLITAC